MPACKVLSVMYTHNEASLVRIDARENGASVIGSFVVVNVHTGAGFRADAGAVGAGCVDGRAPPDNPPGNGVSVPYRAKTNRANTAIAATMAMPTYFIFDRCRARFRALLRLRFALDDVVSQRARRCPD